MRIQILDVLLLFLIGCTGLTNQTQTTTALPESSKPQQPAPAAGQFSWSGFTWQIEQCATPGTGTFQDANVAVADNLTLTLDGLNLVGGEISTVTPLSFGIYEFTFTQDSIERGSVAAGFLYANNSQTEIDLEQQGQFPTRLDFTNYAGISKEQTSDVTGYAANGSHTFKILWEPTEIDWFVDGVQVAQHTSDVPTEPAPFLFNFWSTNSTAWGGLGTPVTRHMTITSFSYTGNS